MLTPFIRVDTIAIYQAISLKNQKVQRAPTYVSIDISLEKNLWNDLAVGD